MRLPCVLYRLEALLGARLPSLRSAQVRGLALWVFGTVLAQNGCQNAVLGALSRWGRVTTLRQYLREWLKDGSDKSRPCASEVDVGACFPALLEWVIACSGTRQLALGLDATTCRDRVAALVLSVLYRGSGIPIAWQMLPGNQKGSWKRAVIDLLERFPPGSASGVSVVVMVDRGLWSQEIYQSIRRRGWHPLMRLQEEVFFRPQGEALNRARLMLPGPGHAWIGTGEFFRDQKRRFSGTLAAVWLEGYKEPILCVTDLKPEEVEPLWYGLRTWIELGFRFLKSFGWQWERTRRMECVRVERHWLVLAVATLLVAANGTKEELAGEKRSAAPLSNPRRRCRFQSVLARGLRTLRDAFVRGHLRTTLRLVTEPLPALPANVHRIYHHAQHPT